MEAPNSIRGAPGRATGSSCDTGKGGKDKKTGCACAVCRLQADPLPPFGLFGRVGALNVTVWATDPFGRRQKVSTVVNVCEYHANVMKCSKT